MSHRTTRRSRQRKCFDHGDPIATIDTRPMVFVMLFVAVIMLLMYGTIRPHALFVELPKSSPPLSSEFEPPHILVEISGEGKVFVDSAQIALSSLTESIQSKGMERPLLLIVPSPDAAYDTVAKALNSIRLAGVAPTDICFDSEQLFEHRHFSKVFWQPSFASPDYRKRKGLQTLPPPSIGCDFFGAAFRLSPTT